jgi:hypothetical protein
MEVALVSTLIVLIVLFVIVRAFWLWYWKINEGIGLLKDIRASLRVLERAAMASAAPGVAAQVQASETIQVDDRVRLARKVQLLDEPRNGARITASVLRGAEVTVLKTEGNWAWIQTDDGREGWTVLPVDR